MTGMPDTRGQVYFIFDGDNAIKVGWSKNPAARLVDLQVSNSKRLVLLGSIPATKYEENIIHRRFSRIRLSGEWFKAEDELWEFIAEFEHRNEMIPARETIFEAKAKRYET